HSPLRIGRVACAGSARVATKRPRRPSPFPPRGGPQMTRASVRLGLLAAATLVFWSVLPGSAPAQTVAYSSARRDFAVGLHPRSVATGDFNGDGVPDLAVASQFWCCPVKPGTFSVLLGNSDGTFRAATIFASGSNPRAVALGDFNADGKLDLVVTVGSAGVSVLLGNGDGTFQAAVNYATGSSPYAVAVGDFNADGKVDLAIANGDAADVSVLLGNGDGTFQTTALTFSTGTWPSSVAVGDFNADGRLDLAVANFGAASVSVLLGNPSAVLGGADGTFQAAPTYAAGTNPLAVTEGDFNRDGVPDLAVANRGSGDIGRDTVSVLLGNGDGTFQAPAFFAVGGGAASVVVDDFNGDGVPDLALASPGYTTHHESYSLVSV